MLKRLMLMVVSCLSVISVGVAEEQPMDTCFQFITWGFDCYEDESPLEVGECYALVWRHNELANSISGLFTDKGEPVDSDKCEILGVFDTAKHDVYEDQTYACASNSWIILPSGHYTDHNTNGVYSVFVFDTRVKKDDEWVLGGKTSDKTVASLRRYGLVTGFENIKLGTGQGGTFFAYNVSVLGTKFIGSDKLTSIGDTSEPYASYAKTPVVSPVSFYVNDETLLDSRLLVIDEPIGELPTPDERAGFRFLGWFKDGDVQVTPDTLVTSGMKLTAKWEAVYVPEPVFSSFAITNGMVYLSVTNTVPSQKYGLSWAGDIFKVFSTTNWIGPARKGEDVVDAPLSWQIDVSGASPQGFFRVLINND